MEAEPVQLWVLVVSSQDPCHLHPCAPWDSISSGIHYMSDLGRVWSHDVDCDAGLVPFRKISWQRSRGTVGEFKQIGLHPGVVVSLSLLQVVVGALHAIALSGQTGDEAVKHSRMHPLDVLKDLMLRSHRGWSPAYPRGILSKSDLRHLGPLNQITTEQHRGCCRVLPLKRVSEKALFSEPWYGCKSTKQA
ncbi:uncharacterized protein EI90DRAFT_2285957 [Cantharellus anzutake]|uniref:uncharacterized protein n=1 Tax=Cantharellus anzutake TaxID=1750568 RepID=UPI001905EF25|nr:uncharacterized protein EI90DRAFT_2285957 [Cantharellus anzutake]KAF8339803.1 hypothetical protein EI90DRAFT_2285957 [Cantharellus anzutake]